MSDIKEVVNALKKHITYKKDSLIAERERLKILHCELVEITTNLNHIIAEFDSCWTEKEAM